MSLDQHSRGRMDNTPTAELGLTTVGMDPHFFEDLSQLCLKAVASGKLPTYRVVAQHLTQKYGEKRYDLVKDDVSTWMQNFCSVQSTALSGVKSHESEDGKSSRKMSYVTIMSKPVFHRAHSHKVCTRTDQKSQDWVCDVCFAAQSPDALRWRCATQCDWDCCRFCMSSYRGRKKSITLRHRKADPIGIIFSQLEVVGCYSGSVAEACGEVLPGDFLVQFDGCEVKTFARLAELVKAKSSMKRGGHDPNALVTTVLVFSEPYPHRDRLQEVVTQQEENLMQEQTTEDLQAEARILRQSIESYTTSEKPSDAERGVIDMMDRKACSLEAEVRSREIAKTPLQILTPTPEAIAAAIAATTDLPSISPRDLLSPDSFGLSDVPVDKSAGAGAPIDHTCKAKERFANYTTLAERLNGELDQQSADDASARRRSVNSPFGQTSISSNVAASESGGVEAAAGLTSPAHDRTAAFVLQPDVVDQRLALQESEGAKTPPRKPLAGASLLMAHSDAATPATSASPPLTPQRRDSGMAVPATPIDENTPEASTANAESKPPAYSSAAAVPAPASAFPIAHSVGGNDSGISAHGAGLEITRLTKEIETARSSEANAFRRLTKINAKLAAANKALAETTAANTALKIDVTDAHRRADAAEAVQVELQLRVKELEDAGK
eukprot:m.24190 g.24190  ORF g.24190 m.24190 type:complete len:666 (+) comp11163_c0_seq1:84-2081(+)